MIDMAIILEISTKNYLDDLLEIKKALSHMETLLSAYNGFSVSEPVDNFGWTDRKSTRLNSSHVRTSRMPSSA